MSGGGGEANAVGGVLPVHWIERDGADFDEDLVCLELGKRNVLDFGVVDAEDFDGFHCLWKGHVGGKN